ncbi:MAG: 2-C-methyl-D-erythritol 4-phosphate cytidylyltransferase [Flavobacteriales bacterium]
MKKSMIIVAGGSGTRMGAEIPKQFIELNGKPILMHTLQKMHSVDENMQLILVLPAAELDAWEQLCYKHDFCLPHVMAQGGSTRFLSVKSGLELAEDSDLIGVHDGVRPLFSTELIIRLFAEAEKSLAAIPVTPVIQSLRKVDGDANQAVNREDYRQVQTPQCFAASVLKKAFANATQVNYSDDAAVVEADGKSISLVEGELNNIKITTPIDLQLAELIIARLPD